SCDPQSLPWGIAGQGQGKDRGGSQDKVRIGGIAGQGKDRGGSQDKVRIGGSQDKVRIGG
ncbi:unnamed protein product, partial [Staurois parvus]